MDTEMVCPRCAGPVEVKPHDHYGVIFWFCHACRAAEVYPGPDVRAELARLRAEVGRLGDVVTTTHSLAASWFRNGGQYTTTILSRIYDATKPGNEGLKVSTAGLDAGGATHGEGEGR